MLIAKPTAGEERRYGRISVVGLRFDWLAANIAHRDIETGLHARLESSRHDDRCRLRELLAR